MVPFTFTPLELPDVVLVQMRAFEDARGFFTETYKHSDFVQAGISDTFVQDNYSRSRQRVLRGLHYQKEPFVQSKLVSVIRGEILDVAVDLRKGSPSYGKWVSEALSDRNRRLLYVPEGFAHGFCVLSDEADVLYKVNREYAPEHERGIVWNDPDLAIDWPVEEPILSSRDADLPPLADADNQFTYRVPAEEWP